MSISLQEGNCAAAGSSHSFTTSHFYGQYVNQKIAVCYYDAAKRGCVSLTDVFCCILSRCFVTLVVE